jgi:hypothetical protein
MLKCIMAIYVYVTAFGHCGRRLCSLFVGYLMMLSVLRLCSHVGESGYKCLFSDTLSSSDHVVLNNWMISE